MSLWFLSSTIRNIFVGREQVTFVRRKNDRWMGEEVVVSINGHCPQQNPDSGLCLIESRKPFSCGDQKPFESELCVKTEGGRHSKYYILIDNIDIQ